MTTHPLETLGPTLATKYDNYCCCCYYDYYYYYYYYYYYWWWWWWEGWCEQPCRVILPAISGRSAVSSGGDQAGDPWPPNPSVKAPKVH